MSSIRVGVFGSVVGLFLAAGTANAGVIAVANSSFETLPAGGLPEGNCGPGCSFSNSVPIPGWTGTGSFGQFQPGVASGNTAYFNAIPDGLTVAYSNGGTIEQTVAAVAQAGVTYMLSVDVGFRKDIGDPGSVSLIVGGNTIVATGTPDPLSGNFATYTASYTALAADAGGAISILLASPAGQGDWDNVRLSDTSVPEPAGLAFLGFGLIAAAALRRKT